MVTNSDSINTRSAGVADFNIRDFGAAGDGVHLDTEAIQAAIDSCSEHEGGTVVVPAGTYLTGTIFLKSNTALHLAAEATLLGSTNLDHYSAGTGGGFLYNTETALWDKCLIYAENVRNTGIMGQGLIDGQGRFFPRNGQTEAGEVALERPMLLRFVECQNVTLRDVRMKDAACWGANLIRCESVKINGVTIDSRVNANNDGIDLEDCHKVHISDCNIYSLDDAIALKDSATDVVITNCILGSYCAAIRLGPESVGAFENIAVSNCVIRDAYHCGIKLQMNEGGRIENVSFSNIVMENVTGPISIRLARWLEEWMPESRQRRARTVGTLRNVALSNIRVRVAEKFEPMYSATEDQDLRQLEQGYLWAFLKYGPAISCISITGLPGHNVEGLTLSNIHVTYPGGGTAEDASRRHVPDLKDEYPEYYMFGVLPAYGLYAHHAKGLVLNDVRFDLSGPDLRPAIVCDDVEDLEISGFRAAASSKAESLIRLQQTRQAFIHGCRSLNDIDTFLRVEGAESEGVVLAANDLRKAQVALETTDGARSDMA